MAIEAAVRDVRGDANTSTAGDSKERAKALAAVLSNLEKHFGKGAVMRLGEQPVEAIRAISTGSIGLDLSIGIGGLPRGRVVEVFGPESSGKTTLTLSAIAECQRAGGTAAFVDAEHALDADYARRIGVDIDALLVSQPDNGEQAMEITEQLVRSGAVDLVVIDSVAALVPKAEIEGEMGDVHMGLQARLMSQALRKLTGCIHKSQACVVFINQLREKIGVMFGSPETTPGGRALKFYSSLRLDIRRIEAIKNGTENIGNRVRVRTVKNKVAPPFRETEMEILFGEGIDRMGNLLDTGEAQKIIDKVGSFYSYGEIRLGQGRERSRLFLKENPTMAKEIETKLRATLKLTSSAPAPAPEVSAPSVLATAPGAPEGILPSLGLLLPPVGGKAISTATEDAGSARGEKKPAGKIDHEKNGKVLAVAGAGR